MLFVYIRLKNEQKKVNNQWNEITFYLNKRIDIIPKLIKTVKLHTNDEFLIFENLNNAAKLLLNAKTVIDYNQANIQLSRAFKSISDLIEKYPELTKDKHFLDIHKQLKSTEEKISQHRNNYNETVRKFNSMCETFPYFIFKAILGFKEKDYFKGSAEFSFLDEILYYY